MSRMCQSFGSQITTKIGLGQKQQDQAAVARAYELQRETFETTRQHQERGEAATERDAEARRIRWTRSGTRSKAGRTFVRELAPVSDGAPGRFMPPDLTDAARDELSAWRNLHEGLRVCLTANSRDALGPYRRWDPIVARLASHAVHP